MRTLVVVALAIAIPLGAALAQCTGCGQKTAPEAPATRPIPGSQESMVVGSIENLMPIGIVAVLGCETCTAKTVAWALQQGSSPNDVERALRTIEAMQKLDCYKQQFGPETAARLEKSLASGRAALALARAH